MVNRFSNIMCWLMLVTVFVGTGCEQEYKRKEEAVVLNPLADPNFIVPGYTVRAIEATGGRQAWIRAKKLEFDCVVTFYRPDDSLYLTEQHYEIYPWLNCIRISADEPQGRFVCQLSGGLFSVLEGAEPVVNRNFAEAILNITTAPVRFLDGSAIFTKVVKPIKMEGQWYYQIRRAIGAAGSQPGVRPSGRAKLVFCQNRESYLVDMLQSAEETDGESFLAVRGYDYKKAEKGGVLVPTKIEIFETDSSGVLKKRLVKIDYYAVKSTD